MSDREVYKCECWSCGRTVELEVYQPYEREIRACPHCGARLVVEWRPADVLESK